MIAKQTLILASRESYFAETFLDCNLILEETGVPRFFRCTFVNCRFEPNSEPEWRDILVRCAVSHPR